ncbi:TetR/AcrR family transcriptional regulator [Undibacterium terreum]|uniref:HTH tetR-type domain-containing protein n=1 Tax=Undibacterium terreum TaxID=1224302 RepID=A0A916U4S5_9BURK|nr:TetR/AcrR family transcriptional regulator [Undibacterium terreum]GGC60542.1 hypothetical protein GCM10011396_04300 [Undibacterium terreum]
MEKQTARTDRSRARATEDKEKVREAIVSAGRQLFATEDPATVSLRRIATFAGYSPATIYNYFDDYRALYTAVRAHEMELATKRFERIAARTKDPEDRVRKLFLGTAQYWLKHLDDFDLVFALPVKKASVLTNENKPFGQSPTVTRALKVYYGAMHAYFDSLPRHPIPARLAADTLLAAVHGIISFPRMTRTMVWSDMETMAKNVIDGMLHQWSSVSK